MAERVGFEPTWGLRPQQISSLRRYDRFGTSPGRHGLRGVASRNNTVFYYTSALPRGQAIVVTSANVGVRLESCPIRQTQPHNLDGVLVSG